MTLTERASADQSVEPKCRILVVDDQTVIRKFIGQVCADRFADYEFLEAGDGEEGWELFKKYQPDIVITDVVMPQVDGIELLRRIRRQSRETEVIMITGFAQTRMVVDALKAGASNFIEKPFTVDTISGELARFLSRWKAAREKRRLESELERERSLREASARLATAGRLMAGLAVEMRNPLTWIKGNAEVLTEMLSAHRERTGDSELSDAFGELLADIRNGALEIENHVSLMRRFQGLTSISEDKDVSLARLLEDSALLAGGKRPRNVELTVTPPPESAVVRLHPVEMESCLVNLIVNAFESVETTGGSVEVKAEVIEGGEDGGWAEINIRARREANTVVRLPREEKDEDDQSFWLWAAHKAAEYNGVHLEMNTGADGGFNALMRLPWFGARSL